MLKDERLEKIEDFVNTNRYASMHELVKLFDISKATIRRDLECLEKAGKVVLTRGGATSVNKGSLDELPYHEKRNANREEKIRIARAAVGRIATGQTVMIDSGTTSFEMAELMDSLSGVIVATNDLMTAVALTKHRGVDLIVIGGGVRRGFYTMDGYFAAANVQNYNFDQAFLCVDAISLDLGCMITNADELDIKRSIIRSSKRVTVMCDHSKFGNTAFVSVCKLDEVDSVITGKELDPAIRAAIVEHGHCIELV